MENRTPLGYVLHPQDDLRLSVQGTLEEFGFRVQAFSESKNLLLVTNEVTPSLFVLDMDPVRSPQGLVLIRAIRERLLLQTPVLVTCDKGQTALMKEAMDAGASDCLVMPMGRGYFAARLHRFISTPRIVARKENYSDLKGVGGQAKLTLTGRIVEIDELGVHLVGGVLPQKGSSFRLDSPILDQIFGEKTYPSATVISVETIKANEVFSVYLEFDENPPLLQAVRRWLAELPPDP